MNLKEYNKINDYLLFTQFKEKKNYGRKIINFNIKLFLEYKYLF